MITTEYTTLMKDGAVVQTMLPNVKFDTIAEGCINTAYCLIRDDEGAIFKILQPGEITPKELPKFSYEAMDKSQLRELCIANEITFATKATKAKLIELLEG